MVVENFLIKLELKYLYIKLLIFKLKKKKNLALYLTIIDFFNLKYIPITIDICSY